ncbi:unnamed protein product [Gongylonema pulchrum]|uniref:Reverse transcriptase n=1 Tax=Gongylonema pulchrum TaxID=637853 RepID=A0A183D383_9BILA|nr:unnamed protein product [Gongylonema pulchrum]
MQTGASRIKVLDPVFVPVEATSDGRQLLHRYYENEDEVAGAQSTSNSSSAGLEDDYELVDPVDIIAIGNDDDDDDIQKALRKLEESRNMLDEPVVLSTSVSDELIEQASDRRQQIVTGGS